jgi:SpoVK/Ycf46/Vps4 family AAA+-type ATPase
MRRLLDATRDIRDATYAIRPPISGDELKKVFTIELETSKTAPAPDKPVTRREGVALKWYQLISENWDKLPARMLLYGPPGTGKSSLPARLQKNVERYALTEDTSADELVGSWALKEGSTIVVPGPAARAMLTGSCLVLDEVDRTGPGVESILHAILDDPEIAVLSMPDGSVIRPEPGYRVIGTTNQSPMTLAEPILDRFDVVIPCWTPHEDAMVKMTDGQKRAVTNYYKNITRDSMVLPLSVRRVRAFVHIVEQGVNEGLAARLVFADGASDALAAFKTAGFGR